MIKRNKKGQFVKGTKPTHGFKKGIVPWSKSQKGIHLSPRSEFKKGMTPWNKGLTIKDKRVAQYVSKGAIARKGKHFSARTEFEKGQKPWNKDIKYLQITDSLHPMWKGNDVSYGALHSWIARKLGKPTNCENCDKINLNGRKIHWANKNGKYKRNLSDWIRLCVSCHKKYDIWRQKNVA